MLGTAAASILPMTRLARGPDPPRAELAAIVARGQAGFALEQAAERRGIVVAYLAPDLVDCVARRLQGLLGLLDTKRADVVDRRIAGCRPEAPGEGAGRQARAFDHAGDRVSLGVMAGQPSLAVAHEGVVVLWRRRYGGKTQLASYRAVAGDLRLSYSQFEELETFSRFATRLDDETRKRLERGRRVREILKQPQYQTMPVAEQIAVFVAVNKGVFDEFSLEQISHVERLIRKEVTAHLSHLCEQIEAGSQLKDEDQEAILSIARKAIKEAHNFPPLEKGG